METTNIEWCDSTFNAWEGCTKVGPGCDHCYAETRNGRFHAGANWGPGAPRLLRSGTYWREPLKWERDHDAFFAEHGRHRRVFCSSLADVFDNEAPAGQRERLFELIKATPHLNWLLLTKRIGNAKRMLPVDWGDGYANVWIGATVVNQAESDRDIMKLLTLPARIRFLSMEPLLGPVDLTRIDIDGHREFYPLTSTTGCEDDDGNSTPDLPALDWVIVGGESGPDSRPMHPDWARDLSDQCAGAGVPLLFKQWGDWVPRGPESMGYPIIDEVPRRRITDAGDNGQDLASRGGNDVWMQRAGKKVAGRLLDGVQHDGYPAP